MARELKDEFTEKMHSEFIIDAETEKCHRAGCVWIVFIRTSHSGMSLKTGFALGCLSYG